jgi:thiol:disulfide interchange protein DsbD
MKKYLVFLLTFLTISFVNAQIKNPVKFSSSVEKISETEFNLVVKAVIEKDWHVYSQFTPDGGPIAMTLEFKDAKSNFELVGKAIESKYKKEFNDIFEVDEYYFDANFTLTQKIKITNPKVNEIKLRLDYQVCKDACINDKQNFVFKIPAPNQAVAKPSVFEDEFAKTETTKSPLLDTISVTEVVKDSVSETSIVSEQNTNNAPKEDEKKGLWTIFFLAFLGGFAALFTPCVFPMIPMTVSFFTKQSKDRSKGIRNAILYGLCIIFIYVFIGLAVTGIFGADALNKLSTDVYFNVIFFLLLVVFAASFLGAFEIMLPNSWANKVDKQADRGGIVGIFFMALALAIVSFSCTGPIVGPLLVESASKGGIAPIIGMLGFSSALALPFMLFALFPGWLQSLPKSGGWLNTVKVSLGFLELALAFKFLSNADLVLQLHWLEREIFLAIWIAIFAIWGLYLLGKITLPHDSPLTHISVGRLGLAIVVFSFVVYMIPGLFGAPLKLISAFPPPQTYSESPNGFFGSISNTKDGEELPIGAKYGEHNIITFTDYDEGLAYAKSVNKPILLDFTGFACVNCRKMEINVWSDERVLQILKNDVVLISLYVDDKRKMPESEQFISPSTKEEITTFGEKWTDFIITKYKTNSQPYYVLIDLKENNLNKPVGYTPNISDYETWLKDGISKFKK